MKSYLLVLISAISMGITTVLYKKSTATIGPVNTTFFYYIIGAIISTVVWLVFKDTGKIDIKDLIYPGLIALFLCLSILTFNLSLVHIKVSIAGTIRALSFVISAIIAVAILREQLGPKQILGIFFAVVSILLFVS